MKNQQFPENEAQEAERYETLQQLEDWLEGPVLVLGFIWLVLLVVELVWGLSPLLDAFVYMIWAIFVLDFGVRVALAPRKLLFLRNNWLTVLSLLVPALRIFRIFYVLRALSAARGLRLVKVVGSLNRGMNALRRSMGRRGFGYVILLTAIVTLVGSAGVFAFESEVPRGQGIGDFGDAMWFTAMIMTTLGSEYWPETAEGRVLTFLLAVYAFAVFGYVTATLATYFIGRETENQEIEIAGTQSIEALRAEVEALRAEIRSLVANRGDSG